jgi:hypothetical protein
MIYSQEIQHNSITSIRKNGQQEFSSGSSKNMQKESRLIKMKIIKLFPIIGMSLMDAI